MKSLLCAATAAAFLALGIPCQAQPGHALDSPLAMLSDAKGNLNLNTSQQLQWDNAAAQAKAAHAAMRVNFEQVGAALQTELGKAEPDLASVSTLADNLRQQNEALRKSARDAWLALYATFTPDQKAVVRDTLKAGIERMQAQRGMRGAPAQN
ncbi:MAG TPA: periplasmic heavy metal sensor [Casimicrobiaceae bacterium]